MRTRLWRIVSLLTLLALLASPFYLGSSTAAAGLEQEIVPQKPGMRIVKSSLVAQSQPLRSLAPRQVDPDARSVLKTLQDRLVIPKSVQGSGGGSDRLGRPARKPGSEHACTHRQLRRRRQHRRGFTSRHPGGYWLRPANRQKILYPVGQPFLSDLGCDRSCFTGFCIRSGCRQHFMEWD